MIAFPRRLIVDHVLTPQGLEERGETRAILSGAEAELGVVAQEIDLLATTTRPLGYEIGGGVELRHEISVAVVVQHGDPAEAVRLRDAIVLELCLRALDVWSTIAQETDPGVPAGAHYPTRLAWSIDWRPLAISDTNETATITFTLDTQLDR